MLDDASARYKARPDPLQHSQPTGPPIPLPLPGRSGSVWVRPGTTDLLVYHDVIVRQQYGRVPLPEVRTVVDCGAHIGLASAYFLCRYPHARVLAVEPDAANHALCRRNLEPFGARASVLRAALWSCRRPLAVRPWLAGTWAASVEPIGATAPADLTELAASAELVEGADVPTLLARAGWEVVDLLKVDVEGAEREVFGTGDLGWLERVRCIEIELHGDDARDAFLRAVVPRGFSVAEHGETETTVAWRPPA